MSRKVAGGVVGVDLSLKRTAACYLPGDWVPGDWAIDVVVSGYELAGDREPSEYVTRRNVIANAVAGFVHRTRPSRVWVEDYAYGFAAKGGSSRIIQIGELRGVVEDRLADLDYELLPLNQSTVRKYFLGKLPRGKGAVPKAVHAKLREAGAPWVGSDEGDAFLVCNYGRTELGLPGLTVAKEE